MIVKIFRKLLKKKIQVLLFLEKQFDFPRTEDSCMYGFSTMHMHYSNLSESLGCAPLMNIMRARNVTNVFWLIARVHEHLSRHSTG